MEIGELKAEIDAQFEDMNRRFEQVDRRFEQVDRRFDQVDRRFEQVDQRFEQVDQRFEQVDQRFEQVDQRFELVDHRFVELSGQIRAQAEEFMRLVLAEGEKTRRHFDVVAEQMKAERNLALDQSTAAMQQTGQLSSSNAAAHAEFERRLDDHEARILRIERE